MVLIPPNGRDGWRARWVDPDTAKTLKRALPSDKAKTLETRDAWARDKSEEIADRRRALEGGAVRAKGAPLEHVIASYYADHATLKPRTVTLYRLATGKLLAWAARNRVTKAEELTRGALLKARAAIAAAPKREAQEGGKRGARGEGTTRRKATSINGDLRALRTVLGYLVDAEQLPRLSHDDLRRGLKREAVVSADRIDYRKPAELRALIAAVLELDAKTFKVTRAEHKRREGIGTTARYTPVAPLVVTATLSGMRASELMALEWEDYDQEANELRVHRTASSTKRARTVDLAVSPMLTELLDVMRPKSGQGSVFAITRGEWDAAEARLIARKVKPSLQALRRTCGTFLTCSPSIYGAASVFMAAKRLGHSVSVSEKHYLGVIRNVDPNARTLEAAMQIKAEVERVIEAARARGK